jgi:hypothetical protein
MTQPDAFARHSHTLHLTAMLKAHHAARLLRKKHSEQFAAARCGYGSVKVMKKAIKQYVKSPAPTGIGNGADQNVQ